MWAYICIEGRLNFLVKADNHSNAPELRKLRFDPVFQLRMRSEALS